VANAAAPHAAHLQKQERTRKAEKDKGTTVDLGRLTEVPPDAKIGKDGSPSENKPV
jgi:hypothetical protein